MVGVPRWRVSMAIYTKPAQPTDRGSQHTLAKREDKAVADHHPQHTHRGAAGDLSPGKGPRPEAG